MASECSEPQSEMFIASPAMRLAQAISWRAARFSPSATTAGSARAPRWMASSAIPVPIGLRESVTIAAIACARASMPPHDVTVRRRAVRERRVDEGVLRPDERRGDPRLRVRLLVGDHDASGDLRARPGGRRNRDERQRRRRRGEVEVGGDGQVRHPGAERQARALGEVDHRAAADRDDDVGLCLRREPR